MHTVEFKKLKIQQFKTTNPKINVKNKLRKCGYVLVEKKIVYTIKINELND